MKNIRALSNYFLVSILILELIPAHEIFAQVVENATSTDQAPLINNAIPPSPYVDLATSTSTEMTPVSAPSVTSVLANSEVATTTPPLPPNPVATIVASTTSTTPLSNVMPPLASLATSAGKVVPISPVIYQQTQADVSQTSNTSYVIQQQLGSGLSGTATKMTVRLACDGVAYTPFFQVYLGVFTSTSTFDTNPQAAQFSQTVGGANSYACSNTTGGVYDQVIDFSDLYTDSSLNRDRLNSLTFDPAKTYWFSIGGSTYNSGLKVYGSSNNLAWGTAENSAYYGYPTSPASTVKDLYFILDNGVTSPVAVATSTAQIDPVLIIPGMLGSWNDTSGKLALDPIFHSYDNLRDTFIANGYIPEMTLFDMPYDWRLSNKKESIQTLKEKIYGNGRNKGIKEICKCSKIDIVAHSMGGLIIRQYIESPDYQNEFDQVVFLGTPHSGSPKAYLMWEGGELGSSATDSLLELLLRKEAHDKNYGPIWSRKTLFDYVRDKVKSVEELLPTFDYIKDKDTGGIRQYPNNYPRNQFLEDLNLASGIDKLLKSGIRIYNISGDAGPNSTPDVIRVVPRSDASSMMWEHGYPDGYDGLLSIFGDHGLEKSSGDDTVPDRNMDPIKNLNNVENLKITSSHNDLPTKAEGRAVELLSGATDPSLVKLSLLYRWLGSFFVAQAFSPPDLNGQPANSSALDVAIVAPNGKKINVKNISEIPNAFVNEESDGSKTIVIPESQDGSYKVEVTSAEESPYNVVVSEIAAASSSQVMFSGKTKKKSVAEKAASSIFVESSNGEIKKAGQNVEGDVLVVPSFPNGSMPATGITMRGKQSESGWFSSDASVSFSSVGITAGVIKYSIGNEGRWHNWNNAPILISSEGLTMVRYYSTAKDGTVEAIKEQVVMIDKTAPEAKIYFDKNSKKLRVEGVDNFSETTVERSENLFIISDKAGNNLKINFSSLSEREGEVRAIINSLQYNNESVLGMSNYELAYRYSVNSYGLVDNLQQETIRDGILEKDFSYSKERDETIVKEIKR